MNKEETLLTGLSSPKIGTKAMWDESSEHIMHGHSDPALQL